MEVRKAEALQRVPLQRCWKHVTVSRDFLDIDFDQACSLDTSKSFKSIRPFTSLVGR